MPRNTALAFLIFFLLKENFAFECGVGQYQKDAECEECKTTCAKCISEFLCTECKAGFFGEACSKNCSESCKMKLCLKETGDCLSCNKGYYPDETCKRCPDNCTECHNANRCTKCKTGYTGSTCQKLCVNCKPDSGCSLEEGICTVDCKDGYSGHTCLEVCESYCLSCNRVDARKCISCVDGKYGNNCDKSCPAKCKGNSCSIGNGTCTHGCQNGFWGDQCQKDCPRNCWGRACLKDTGVCSDGCYGNFKGGKCLCPKTCECDEEGTCIECDDNSGYVCDKQCRSMCLNNICSMNVDQKCLYGCKEGYKDSLCIQGTTEPEEMTPVWKIVVPIFATAAIIVLSCVLLSVLIKKRGLVCRRCQTEGLDAKEYGAKERFLPPESSTKDQEANPYDVIKNVDASSNENILTHLTNGRPDEEKTELSALPTYQEIGSEDACPKESSGGRPNLVAEQTREKTQESTGCLSQKSSEQGFLSTKISTSKLKDMTSEKIIDGFKRLSASTENKEVEVTSLKTNSVSKIYQDAFNACYIDGYRKTEAYIACACPVFKQMELFWNMVWEEGCDRIVMLSDSNINEQSEHYWPKLGYFFKHGDLVVKCLSIEDIDDEFIQRNFAVKRETEERTVLQLHFMGWPENLIPRSASSLIEFQKYRDQITSEKIVPIVIHCRDGIGRTGTYIAFDRLIQEGKATGSVDVFTCVRSLREQRSLTQELGTQGKAVVQTHEQYCFLYEVLQSWFKLEYESKTRQHVRQQTVDSACIHMGKPSEPNTIFNMFSLLDSLDTS